MLDFLQYRLDVRDFARLFNRWSNEALKLVSVDDCFVLGELQVEFLDEISSFDNEANIFVTEYFLRGKTWNIDPRPVRTNDLPQQIELVKPSVSFKHALAVLSNYLVYDVFTI